MHLLVSGCTQAVERHAQHPCLGTLMTPRTRGLKRALRLTPVAGADNDCFQCLDATAYRRMLHTLADSNAPSHGLRWVSVPDVVGNADATLALFGAWNAEVRDLGLPTALVAQDGLEDRTVPWADFDALFIGGSTAWKLGPAAARLVLDAKQHGKWVHIGRVNSVKRMRHFDALGADSFDGTGYSRFPQRIAPMLRQLEHSQQAFLPAYL